MLNDYEKYLILLTEPKAGELHILNLVESVLNSYRDVIGIDHQTRYKYEPDEFMNDTTTMIYIEISITP